MNLKPKRSWLCITKVSLRFFFIVFTVLCVWIGWYILRWQAQRSCVREILKASGGVVYSHRYTNGVYNANPVLPGLTFVREGLGLDFVDHVIIVDFNHHEELDQLPDLDGLPRLESLLIPETNVTDLSPASGLANLESLWIARTPITNLGPIKNNKKLEWINICDTNIVDLSPLFDLPNLKTLVLTGAGIPPDQIDKFRSRQPDCEIFDESPK